MARKRRKRDNDFNLILFTFILLMFSQWFLELLAKHTLLVVGAIIAFLTLYFYIRREKKKRKEKRRQELLNYNSNIQKKAMKKMRTYINTILQLEKYKLSKSEKDKKKKIKEEYYKLYEQMTYGYVYIIQEGNNGYVKIGKANDPMQRVVHGLGAKSPYAIELLHLIPTHVPLEVEKWFHKQYDKHRINGECFKLNDNQKARIQSGDYPLELLEIIIKKSTLSA